MKKLTFASILLFICFVFLSAFEMKSDHSDENKLIFEYISYEYGLPLQKTDTSFQIRRTYQVYDNRELIVIDRLYKGYQITKITLNESLYDSLYKLENLRSMIIRSKLNDGEHYAGAYDFISLFSERSQEKECFILPFVCPRLRNLVTDLYKIKLSEGIQVTTETIPTQVETFKAEIIPIHNKSNLPKIELPPRRYK
jgi:hypothetical protein